MLELLNRLEVLTSKEGYGYDQIFFKKSRDEDFTVEVYGCVILCTYPKWGYIDLIGLSDEEENIVKSLFKSFCY